METNQETNKIEKREREMRFPMFLVMIIFVISVLVSAVFGAAFGFLSAHFSPQILSKISNELSSVFPGRFSKPSNQISQENKQQVLVEDSAVIDVVKNSSPAVVSVIISKSASQFSQNSSDPFSQFFGYDPFGNDQQQSQPSQEGNNNNQEQQIGGGTGFFISQDGMIVTNKHVVEDTSADYSIKTNDGKEYPAKVLARDPVQDVAILKIDGTGFPILPIGDSDQIQIGQTVVAIGNSLGEFANSVSRGIVSGLKRNVSAGSDFGSSEQLNNIIQTDAAINPGNSGGPLLDINGNVIGVNVAMAQGAQSIGFALPINSIKRVIEQVKATGKISAPFLGVRYMVIDKTVQQEAQLPFDYGVLVVRGSQMTDLAVVPGSPADKAGIVENDIILEADGQQLTPTNQLGDIISKHNVGDNISLKVWHKGQTENLNVTLAESK
jgi:serine protease Do